MLSQTVEERVRRGVAPLSGADEVTGGGGEEDERRQVHARRQFVQVVGAVGLGPEHRLDLLVGQ